MPKNQNPNIDADDDFDLGDIDSTTEDNNDDELDDLDAILLKEFERLDAMTEEDTQVFSGPVKETENSTVPMEQGIELLDKATFDRGAKRRADPVVTPEDPAAGQQPAAPAAAEPAAQGADAPVLDLDTLLEGLDEDRRGKVKARVTEADEVMSIFEGRDDELKRHGVDRKQAVARLVQLNEYATKNPDKYLAWAATQIDPEKAEDILTAAAERLGLRVVRPEEDDPFEDAETKRLRAENRRLKRGQLDFGPDVDAQAQPAPGATPDPVQAIQQFATAKATDGKPLRPLWDKLKGDVVQKAVTHRNTTGQVVTVADLERFYTESETELKAALGITDAPAASPAAQPAAPVATDGPKKAAPSDAVQRAKAASKNIDGTGQGAGRRPALSQDASLDATLRHFMAADD